MSASLQNRLVWALTLVIGGLLCVTTLSPSVPSIAPTSNDKMQHFIGFALLAAPLALAYPQRTLWVILGVTAFGGAIELVQPFVGRDAEWGDLAADALGAATAALSMRLLRRLG